MFVIKDVELPCPRCLGRGKIDIDITEEDGYGNMLKTIKEININKETYKLIFRQRYSTDTYSNP